MIFKISKLPTISKSATGSVQSPFQIVSFKTSKWYVPYQLVEVTDFRLGSDHGLDRSHYCSVVEFHQKLTIDMIFFQSKHQSNVVQSSTKAEFEVMKTSIITNF